MQAASALRSDLVCSAKLRNERPTGCVTSASDGASSAATMVCARPVLWPSTRLTPRPPRIAERTRAGWLRQREGGDARAHRIAHDVGALDAEMIEQRAHIVRHQRHRIVGGIVQLAGGAVAAVVERDGAAAGAGERTHPSGIDPVHLLGRGKAVHQDDGLALAFVEISDLDFAMSEIWHRFDPLSEGAGRGRLRATGDSRVRCDAEGRTNRRYCLRWPRRRGGAADAPLCDGAAHGR